MKIGNKWKTLMQVFTKTATNPRNQIHCQVDKKKIKKNKTRTVENMLEEIKGIKQGSIKWENWKGALKECK